MMAIPKETAGLRWQPDTRPITKYMAMKTKAKIRHSPKASRVLAYMLIPRQPIRTNMVVPKNSAMHFLAKSMWVPPTIWFFRE